MDESRTAECPSEPSAASAAGQREAADAVVTLYENGPLIVRGRFVLTGQDGQLIPAGRRTVALCRCGGAAPKPVFGGSPARGGFPAPRPAPGGPAAAGRPRGGCGAGPPPGGAAGAAAPPAADSKPTAD